MYSINERPLLSLLYPLYCYRYLFQVAHFISTEHPVSDVKMISIGVEATTAIGVTVAKIYM